GKSVADGDGFNDTTIIVSGGNQGIELAAKVFCNEGDTVICENPTFIGGLNAFRSCGYNTVGVPIEEDGMNVQALEETIKNTPNAKLLYIIPTFQNPAGITTSFEKRKAIYEVCKKYGLMILEDNPYGELRFAGEEIPTIKSFDTEGLVIYCSSFSKILSAGMRVGFVVAPEEVAAKMVVAKQSEDVHTNQFFQMLCYKFMTECDLDAHIAMIREVYGRKCKLMLECLEKELPAAVKFTRPEGGLFIWVTLPDGVDATAFLKASMAEKLMIVPGATFNCDVSEGSMSFRLNYSTPSDQQIMEGVARLGKVAREFVK
ncbi:MAG: PLP-dependent aminotransferase family protein, partial [Clostridia bacterium]|nr:PLP-dependent aminotransferase family protein [Clostridia bacterium]